MSLGLEHLDLDLVVRFCDLCLLIGEVLVVLFGFPKSAWFFSAVSALIDSSFHIGALLQRRRFLRRNLRMTILRCLTYTSNEVNGSDLSLFMTYSFFGERYFLRITISSGKKLPRHLLDLGSVFDG